MSISQQSSWVLTVTLALTVSATLSDNNSQYNNLQKPITSDIDSNALFLTPYIENGQIKEAQKLARVPPMLSNIKSFAGFLTVNKTSNSNLFFWLFKSLQGKWKECPIIVWLQGGIGHSFLKGLVGDISPFSIDKGQLKRRKYSWNRRYNLLFIDNPVGSGFSFTAMDSGYAKDVTDVARDFYEVLIQLHKLFPSLKRNKLIVTGESYGAKYAVAIAYKIYKMNQVSEFKLNLARLILASAHLDPISITKRSSYLYNIGVIDKTQQLKLMRREEEIRTYIKTGDYLTAIEKMNDDRKEIANITGFKNINNFVRDKIGSNLSELILWFTNKPEIRIALHVGSYRLSDGKEAFSHMADDVARSAKVLLEELLTSEAFPIMFISGQLDIEGAYPQLLDFYNSLRWPNAKTYQKAKRCQFKVGNRVAGYYKTAGTFTEVLQRNSGHLVGATTPRWAFKLIDRFIENNTFFQCL